MKLKVTRTREASRRASKMQQEMESAQPVTLTTTQLKVLCDRAEALRFSTGPNERFWEDVDPNGRHVAGQWFRHWRCLEMWKGMTHPFNFDHNGGVNIRALVFCKMTGRVEPTLILCDFDEPQFITLVGAG